MFSLGKDVDVERFLAPARHVVSLPLARGSSIPKQPRRLVGKTFSAKSTSNARDDTVYAIRT